MAEPPSIHTSVDKPPSTSVAVQCIMSPLKSKALAGLFRAYRTLGKDLRESKEAIIKLEKRLLFVELYPKISRMFPQLRKVAMMTDLLLKEVNDEKIKQL